MDFDKNLIEIFLKKAVKNLFTNQHNIDDFTSESGNTEWNLCHHLAIEIHKFFPEYNCDIEITKEYSGYKRPDIILHRRGNHDDNFLVIEGKSNDEKGSKEDEGKIKEHWFGKPLHYQFGAVVNFKGKDAVIEVFQNIDDENYFEGGTVPATD